MRGLVLAGAPRLAWNGVTFRPLGIKMASQTSAVESVIMGGGILSGSRTHLQRAGEGDLNMSKVKPMG